ncbi:MAG: inorganic diphosphatase [Ignavibacteriaceae bacterium]
MVKYDLKNPWHCVSRGKEYPAVLNSVIEISKGSKAKYELDKESGLLRLDRVLFSAVHYPANYGFIPQTIADDNDPLDILVISSIDVEPMCIVEAKVIGVMHMIDSDERDEKIIAVANNDIAVNYINSLEELPPHTMVELKRFFEDYKALEHKHVEVNEFMEKEFAFKIIKESVQRYEGVYSEKIEAGR